MRKIACTLAAIIAISTLTGCPANKSSRVSSPDSSVTEPADLSSGSAVESNSAGNEAASAGDPAQGEDSTAPEIPTADDFIPTIDQSRIYRSGTWYFTAKDQHGNNKHYLYIADNKELIEFEPEGLVVDVSGYLVAYSNDKLMNIKTGEIYAGGDTGFKYIKTKIGRDSYKYAFANDGTAMIVKIDPGFDSVSVNIGILNNDGTWRNEVTSDNNFDTHTDYDPSEWIYFGDGFVGGNGGGFWEIYDTDHNNFLSSLGSYIYSNDTNAFFMGSEYYGDYIYLLYCLDKKTDEIFYYNLEFEKEDKARVIYNNYGSCIAYNALEVDHHVIGLIYAHNMEKDEGMEFDISAFEISIYDSDRDIVYGVLDNALMFKTKGVDGNEYICMINQEGERIIEPKIMHFVCMVGDKFICSVDGTLTMFDASGKETKLLKGALAHSDLDTDNYSSFIAVETDEGFKLVDLNNPENPFTPFDAV